VPSTPSLTDIPPLQAADGNAGGRPAWAMTIDTESCVSWRLVAGVTAGWRLAPMTCRDRTAMLRSERPLVDRRGFPPFGERRQGPFLRSAVRRASGRCCGCSVADAPGCSGHRRYAATARASARIPVPPEPPAPRAFGGTRTRNHPLRIHWRKSFVIDERDQLSEYSDE
jgi:hypothetical protein